jgi:rhodanese-related sulfurtransferase
MGIFSLPGFGKNKIREALQKGAVIIDVRTAHEFDTGKVSGSINIPVDRISANIERIRSIHKPIIVCCSRGERSEKAVTILKENGIKEVYNGGGWTKVLKLINSL